MDHEISIIGGPSQTSFLTYEEYEHQGELNQIFDQDYEMVDQSDPNQQEGQQRRGYDIESKFVPARKVTNPDASKKYAKHDPPIISPTASDNQNNAPIPQQKQNSVPIFYAEIIDIGSFSFNFEFELKKIKVPIPLTELMKHPMYKNVFAKILQPSQNDQDTVNLQDDRPQIYMSTLVVYKSNEKPPPFYLSFNNHNKLLHNFLLDSGASHNLMPKGVMEDQTLR